MGDKIRLLDVTSENVTETGVFCIKNKKAPGYKTKLDWFKSKLNNGLRIKIAQDENDKQIGFIEYIPSELAWRPINASNYLFIQCIVVFDKAARSKKIGSELIKACEVDAKQQNKEGVCTMTSDGVWMANKTLFEKNGFTVADTQDRFELMYKAFSNKSHTPEFIDWTKQAKKFMGWHLFYANQCPWHIKSVKDLEKTAAMNGIDLLITKLSTPEVAQSSPSGFGTFSLVHNGKLLSDHYISSTRFKNIIKQEETI